MRNFKVILWIVIIFLIQTVVLARIHFLGAVPSVVLPYIVCIMILENEFRHAAAISVMCAALAGALCGRDFSVMVLYYTYSSIIIFALRSKPAYIPGFVKAVFYTFMASGLLEIIIYVMKNLTLNADILLYGALPTAAINAVLAVIIYPVLKKIMYKEEKKKLLIRELV